MKRLILLALIGIVLLNPVIGYAHGAKMEYNTIMSYEITARYDSGEPMAEAQIIVYAPEDPAVPWATGITDENGRYIFAPDLSQKGMWTIQARKAGHGAQVNIELGGTVPPAADTGYTWLQKLVMASSVVWGLLGTALFFSRRKK